MTEEQNPLKSLISSLQNYCQKDGRQKKKTTKNGDSNIWLPQSTQFCTVQYCEQLSWQTKTEGSLIALETRMTYEQR